MPALTACLDMPTEKIREAAERDFMALVAVATADALYPTRMRVSTARWLRTREMNARWRDALLYAEGDARKAHEWALHSGMEIEPTREKWEAVKGALRQADALRTRFRDEDRSELPVIQTMLDLDRTARLWLRRYYREEYELLFSLAVADAGLGQPPEVSRVDARDVYDAVQRAVMTGLWVVETPPQVEALLGVAPRTFKAVVDQDCRKQVERNSNLRHPLLLGRWKQALEELLEENWQLARARSKRLVGSPPEEWLRRAAAREVEPVLRKRRYVSAVLQRIAEQEELSYQAGMRVSALEREAYAPWAKASEEAVDLLVEEHILEYGVIHSAVLKELALPDGTLAYHPQRTGPRRAVVRREVFARLDELTGRAEATDAGPDDDDSE